jgi:(p)ppGpp synthase/HD superfamily hydrolase
MNTTEYAKLRQTIRSQLSGMAKNEPSPMAANAPSYNDCLRALNFAEKVHVGLRKDGKTLEFYHQLSILGFLITQHANLEDPRSVYIAAILHDTPEDYPQYDAELTTMFPRDIANIKALSKYRAGELIPYKVYFGEMETNPVTSVVKLVDRIHNLSSMVGVFTPEKKRKYVEEVTQWFLPMAKEARNNFPRQKDFYELAKSVLSMYVSSFTYFLDELEKKNPKAPARDISMEPGL